ncbi:hypothetical protein FQN50_001448 [Emmonsiellopsis sp. PD_5]|nr:hypothetical protein FQN50_001448 [Emmonsiellopsis sp. PD_5]
MDFFSGGTLRGDGLFRVHSALQALQDDPQQVNRRFSDSPPSYRSHQSHNSTRSQSSNPPTEEQRQREERHFRLLEEWQASVPYEQFSKQRDEETERIIKADRDRTEPLPGRVNFDDVAYQNVKKRWVEQGIWNDNWTYFAHGKWKHEEPLEVESETETDRETVSLFGKRSRQKSDEEKQRILDRLAIRKREREASRPFHQFVYQLLKESERIQRQTGNEEANATTAADINAKAYETVKSTWVRRKIWNVKWGILPGMTWKHEHPFEEFEEEEADGLPPVQANPLGDDSHNEEEAPRPPLFTFGLHNQTDTRQTSGGVSTPRREQSAGNSVASADGDVERFLDSNTPPHSQEREILGPTTGQMEQSNRALSPGEDRQPPSLNETFLGPVHSPKVSKSSAAKKRPGPRRRSNRSAAVTLGGPSSLLEPAANKSLPKPASTPPRRSERLRRPEPRAATKPDVTASPNPPKAASRPKPKKGKAKSTVSAKPQGVSKNRRSSAKSRKRK